jgi:hypothetical protein
MTDAGAKKREAVLYAAVAVLVSQDPPRAACHVLADVLADTIHDSAPELTDALLSADELNHRIKQRLRALAAKGRAL